VHVSNSILSYHEMVSGGVYNKVGMTEENEKTFRKEKLRCVSCFPFLFARHFRGKKTMEDDDEWGRSPLKRVKRIRKCRCCTTTNDRINNERRFKR